MLEEEVEAFVWNDRITEEFYSFPDKFIYLKKHSERVILTISESNELKI